jgi:hypothetical protein
MKAVKQVTNVMGSRRGLGVALKTESRLVGAGQALQGAVEQRDVGGTQVGRQGFLVYRKTVVLAGDADAARVEVFDRVIGAMVAKLHLESFGPRSQGHDLVAQANAKGGRAGIDQLAHG